VTRTALLVVADLWWPGWHVTVDGAERPIYRVDYLFRGVTVGPGRHLVRFWYRPVAFESGAVVTATTVVMLVLIGGLRRRRRAST
jgi:uncharacterized membrane protein YfhO